MRVFYNEWDAKTASWLRELCKDGHLPSGFVDDRSITEITFGDLNGYHQCHFFAGIGGWPLALRWAGLERVAGVWTGSPPCQPFSVAGRRKGYNDERHLAPVWANLASQCLPSIIFGEQVEAAIRTGWLDDLCDTLEGRGYACASAILPACSVGAPHLRKRLFFGAIRLADLHGNGRLARASLRSVCPESDPEYGISAGQLVYPYRQHESAARNKEGGFNALGASAPSSMGDPPITGSQRWKFLPERSGERTAWSHGLAGRSAHPYHGFWNAADWLGCRDGRFRPVEPGSFPLANGVPARVGRLRGYGNAIVPQVAVMFIRSFMGAIEDLRDLNRGDKSDTVR